MRRDGELCDPSRLSDEFARCLWRDPLGEAEREQMHAWEPIEAVLESRNEAHLTVGYGLAMSHVLVEPIRSEVLRVVGQSHEGDSALKGKAPQLLGRIEAIVRVAAMNVDDTHAPAFAHSALNHSIVSRRNGRG